MAYKPYKSYVFRTRDPIMSTTMALIEDAGLTKAEIVRMSGVSSSTLQNYSPKGKTRRPQFAPIEAIGRACGKTLTWVDLKK